jgi:hypothetical protein
VHGAMSNPGLDENALHVCLCEPGWSGHACDLCGSASVCPNADNFTVCDKTAIIATRKVFACDSTDKQLEELGIRNLSFAIQFDAAGMTDTTGTGAFQGKRE